jgi:hypothetical protein
LTRLQRSEELVRLEVSLEPRARHALYFRSSLFPAGSGVCLVGVWS